MSGPGQQKEYLELKRSLKNTTEIKTKLMRTIFRASGT
jgi:hypothetical protein